MTILTDRFVVISKLSLANCYKLEVCWGPVKYRNNLEWISTNFFQSNVDIGLHDVDVRWSFMNIFIHHEW